jgi:hypothetical protein
VPVAAAPSAALEKQFKQFQAYQTAPSFWGRPAGGRSTGIKAAARGHRGGTPGREPVLYYHTLAELLIHYINSLGNYLRAG